MGTSPGSFVSLVFIERRTRISNSGDGLDPLLFLVLFAALQRIFHRSPFRGVIALKPKGFHCQVELKKRRNLDDRTEFAI